MTQPISDYKQFFADAKQALREALELSVEEDRLKEEEKELSELILQENKSLNDSIDENVKKRRRELIDTYDAEIKKLELKLKDTKTDRQDARSKAVNQRINKETAHLYEDIKNDKKQIKDICKISKLPAICGTRFYHIMYFPVKLYEYLIIFLLLLVFFGGIPVLIYYYIPQKNPYYLIAIYTLLISITCFVYIIIAKLTKHKNIRALKEIRSIFNEISATKKKIKKLEKSIVKNKDDSIYNLDNYDNEINELEEDITEINIKKKEAVSNFDNSTRHIIADEILAAAKPRIEELDTRYKLTVDTRKKVSKELKDKNIYISENFEVYVGKEYLDAEKLDALADIMDKAIVTNLSEAIEEYKNSMEV